MDNSLGYKDSRRFLKEYNNITYPEFDYYSVTNLNLFSSLEDIDFNEIDKRVSDIEACIPAMKRIFAKPIIHLIDEDVIVPVEAVRLINNKTMSYASNHSELWEDITENGIKPKKLLTNNYRDNYAIYENVVFARTVDYAINYVKHFTRILSDLIYTNKKMEIDLLERENHMSYYLALGKLETGYIRSFSEYADVCLRLISRMEFIYKVLHARLRRPVYVKCHKVRGKIKLRKTNILAMQKDYKKVYKLIKSVFNADIDDIKEDIDSTDYLYYSKFLTLFSIGHFNFQIDKDKKIDFNKLNYDFKFKDYNLNIRDAKAGNNPAIQLTFNHDKEYKILLIPGVKEIKLKTDIEYHVLSYDFDTDDIFISINNIDSFRRIQQVLLKGMINSSNTFNYCPFCGNELKEENGCFYCSKCRMEIKEEYCPNTDKSYYVTDIKNYKLHKKDDEISKNSLFQKRMNEGLMHYRNITKITSDLSNICPYCNIVHETKDIKD